MLHLPADPAWLRPYLLEKEAENNMFLGTMGNLPLYLAALECQGRPTLAAVYKQKNLVLAGFARPDRRLVDSIDFPLPGVIGPAALVERFVQLWPESSQLGAHQRIYALREVVWPRAEGAMRPVQSGDEETLFQWLSHFHHEALPFENFDVAATRRDAAGRIGQNTTFFWVVKDVPVAMAALARPTENGICVNAVYTPVDQRGRGYAAGLVAAISAEGLRRGKSFCMLYADLANPTSNRIYQRLGYRPVVDCSCYRFGCSVT